MITSSLESEQALLGIVLWDEEWHEKLSLGLLPSHFYEPVHGRMYGLALERIKAGQRCDPVLMTDLMAEDKALQELGGVKYLADLVDRAPPSANLNDYAGLILAAWQAREMKEVWDVAHTMRRPSDMLALLKEQIDRIDSFSIEADDLETEVSIGSDFIDALSEKVAKGETFGLSTGIQAFDERVGGLVAGDLIIVAGRPGQGKTSLARNLLEGAARLNPDLDFLFFSGEMSKHSVVARSLSAAAYRDGKKIPYSLTRKPSEGLVYDLTRFKHLLRPNIHITGKDHPSLDFIRRKCLQIKKRRRLGAIVIDYIQIAGFDRDSQRNQAIGEFTEGLKSLAKELGIAVIALSQLGRQVESRDDKRPMSSDLRDSGSIESDADIVLFPFRKHHYLKQSPPKKDADRLAWEDELEACKRRMTLIFDKVRQGAQGDEDVFCHMAYDIVADQDPLMQQNSFDNLR